MDSIGLKNLYFTFLNFHILFLLILLKLISDVAGTNVFEKENTSMYALVYGKEEKVSHPFADFSLISTPVYVQSYIYALGIREMLFNKFNTRGLYGKRDEFETIRRYYMFPAYSLSWREKVENICGEKFSFKYIGKYICGK